MTNSDVPTKLGEALKVNEMSEAQQAELATRLGNIVVESALNQLLVALDEVQIEALQAYLENVGQDTDVIAYLHETYPQFESIFNEEMASFQAESEKVVGQ